MKKYKLGDICEITSGSTPKTGVSEYWDGNIKWITPAELNDDTYIITDSVRKITELAVKQTGLSPIPKGTVILSSRAPIGKVAIAGCEMYCNQGFKNLICSEKIDNRYLYWFLKGNTEFLNSLGRGATFKEISKSIVASIEINVPDLKEQLVVVENLEKINRIITLRKKELNELDNLIRARFVEMFGEPQINPFHWDVVNISEVIGGKVSNGFFAKRDDYSDDGNVSVLGVANIVNRMYSKVDELPKTNANNKDIEKFEVKYGDMLFCRSSLVAEGIGKASIVPEDVQDNVLFECHVIRLPLNLNKCVPEFIQTLSTMDFFRNQVVAQSKTATMTTIGQDGILKTDIILPPIEKQKEFYDFVKQIDKSKDSVQKALDEAQLLFDSLMQQYFG
ncbi:restriction endonuclease subunit S [Clostridium sp. AF20-17LB]|nr:restriction endonuclease subunit S [Clostridium sp. AF20-17LB]RHR09227.1 restriction endonuclease subunit S [Clostridium sp. AF20-17LB]